MSRPPRSILIVNQPWSNHGDEAAHKALIRMLRQRFPDASLKVVAFADLVTREDLSTYRPREVENLEYEVLQRRPSVSPLRAAAALSIDLAAPMLRAQPGWGHLRGLMADADLIVSSPSGVDLGPYRTWLYLALLLLAVGSGTPTAIYSISFGPLPDATLLDRRFSALALDVLRRVDFFSLRETESQALAERLGVPFVPATDTAFIDTTRAAIPESIESRLESPYAIVVPNELSRWHPRYESVGSAEFEALYHAVIACLLDGGAHVILMPQLFAGQNDERYFELLRSHFDAAEQRRILVVPDHYPVEVQKALVAGAELVVAARYHAIIFALIEGTPFFALSYEHKIESHLVQAGLTDYMVSLEKMGSIDPRDVARRVDALWSRRDGLREEISRKAAPLGEIAQETARTFALRFGQDAGIVHASA